VHYVTDVNPMKKYFLTRPVFWGIQKRKGAGTAMSTNAKNDPALDRLDHRPRVWPRLQKKDGRKEAKENRHRSTESIRKEARKSSTNAQVTPCESGGEKGGRHWSSLGKSDRIAGDPETRGALPSNP